MTGKVVFSTSYAEARSRFLEAAEQVGARLTHFKHPTELGPDGEELFLDCAMLGPRDAESVVVVGSGTHGVEGYAGSAAQTAWMLDGGPIGLQESVAVLLSHAHNPWGFAHKARVTEENVDLNRNFVDHSRPYPANPGYADLHRLVTPETWNEERIAKVIEQLQALKSSVGEQAFSDAFNGGQYTHADGLFFGGSRAQWGNQAFREAVHAHLAGAKRAALIDFHTGIGPYLDHVYLCFHAEGTPAYERARAWWGDRAVNRQGVTHKAVANYHGLLVKAFVDMLPEASTTAVLVEFGTRPRVEMQRANIAARWLRFGRGESPELVEKVRADYVESCYPSDARWRTALLEQSREIIDRALLGIATG